MSLLSARAMTAHYGDFQALFGIDFDLAEGEIAAVIGANGAGKSTFLRGVAGLTATPPGAVQFNGAPIGGLPAHRIARLGIGLVPEGRRLFPSLTVEENLLLGMSTGRRGAWSLDRVYALFPRLSERRTAPATLLSGGEQQMAAIGRALMGNPRVLMCDEISLGLAPAVIKAIYDALPGVVRDGLSLIIVEQDVGTALAVADRVYCFQHGRVALSGRAADLTRAQISSAYFGL